MTEEEKMVRMLYTNYRGKTAMRTILPERIWFGETEWHPEKQWLLDAFDLDKRAPRTFALKNVKAWFVE